MLCKLLRDGKLEPLGGLQLFCFIVKLPTMWFFLGQIIFMVNIDVLESMHWVLKVANIERLLWDIPTFARTYSRVSIMFHMAVQFKS